MSVWEAVIGLEVHARLLTDSKIFCGCSTAFGAAPNSHVCPVCLGYPGALPVLNQRAVHLALRMALATGCTIHNDSVFARKNYFYPDLPKGYQISQFDRPLATEGKVGFSASGSMHRVTIRRIHMEEDAGKSMHQTPWEDVSADFSLVDLNRAGVPLIEIVSEPEIHSSEEAVAYLTRLRQLVMYTGACDGNMEEGSLRCDANVSVRRRGEPLGTRAEVKNLNSFRFVGRAIEYEIERQIALLEGGGTIVQETRLYDVDAGETRSMRSKEEAHDYRYFPEPDLLTLHVDDAWIDRVREEIPPLPAERSARYQSELGIPAGDAETLVASRETADYFEAVAAESKLPRQSANWVKNEVLGTLNDRKIALDQLHISPSALARLVVMIESGAIGGKIAKEIFEELSINGGDPDSIVEAKGLAQISDPEVIREAARRVLEKTAAQVEQYRGGKASLFGFFVGQVMKEMRGKANATITNEILRELLDR